MTDPWDEPSKRSKDRRGFDPFSFPFGDFDREFERMRHLMDDMVKQMVEGKGVPDPKTGKPFVYGFSMRVGPDGKPQFQEFGNTRNVVAPGTAGETTIDAREPLVDVIEHDTSVSVTAEIPGVQKEDVQLNVAPDSVTLKVDTAERKYFKQVTLPCRVVPKTADATFNNGVLDLTIERESVRKDEGTRVQVK